MNDAHHINTSESSSPATSIDAPRPLLTFNVDTAPPAYCDGCDGEPVEGAMGVVPLGATPEVNPALGTPGTAPAAVVGVVAGVVAVYPPKLLALTPSGAVVGPDSTPS